MNGYAAGQTRRTGLGGRCGYFDISVDGKEEGENLHLDLPVPGIIALSVFRQHERGVV